MKAIKVQGKIKCRFQSYLSDQAEQSRKEAEGEDTHPTSPQRWLRDKDGRGALWKTSDFVVVWLIPPQQVTVCLRAHGLSGAAGVSQPQGEDSGWTAPGSFPTSDHLERCFGENPEQSNERSV